MVPFFALHDDDRGLKHLARFAGILRGDDDFMKRYYEVADSLRARYDVCARGSDGFYTNVDSDSDPEELWTRAATIGHLLGRELGPDAVAVLNRAGCVARLNEIDLVCVTLAASPE